MGTTELAPIGICIGSLQTEIPPNMGASLYMTERPFANGFFDLMDYYDEFSLDDPEWKSQADLERAILGKFALSGKTPSESTVRALIRKPLAQWRAQKAGN
jgi:hypothetical protein